MFDCDSAQIVYIGVMGQETENQFTLIVWDILFTPERDEITVLEGQTGMVYDVSTNIKSEARANKYVK